MKSDEIGSKRLITTLGEMTSATLPPGLILPHEHIFVDLRPPDEAAPDAVDPAEVVGLMAPELSRAQAAGVGVLVVCTPLGVGRRADLVLTVSKAAGMAVVMPTGVYREPWIPAWVREATESEVCTWMLGELRDQIEETGVRAAWIKLSAGDDGMTSCERKVLRAAAAAAAETGAVIGSHTIRGRVVMDQLDLIESAGYTAERFIWIHTQAEPDITLHEAAAQRGAWIEYDAIGSEGFSDEVFVEHIHRMLGLGYERQLLLSHDRGWYDPVQPGGGTPRPFTYISETFLPKLRASGVDDATIRLLTRENPFRAFARA
ncbi:MAG: phosphotriesterase family protein [Anaerolineae bacterium]